MIDRTLLEEEFNLQAQEVIADITRATGSNAPTINNPNKYVEDNIERANKIMDKVLEEISNGNFTPRLAEVGALLANSVTIAYEKILSKHATESSLKIKKRILELKERELDIKEKALSNQGNIIHGNIIVSDRESMLRFLNGDPPKLLNNNDVIDVTEK